MNSKMPLRLLLGPQRPIVNLDSAVARSGIGDGPIGVISAAWQEAEGDIDDVQRLVLNPLFDLRIYERTEELFAADKRLHEAYRLRQDRLKEQQRLYRMRLRHLMVAARQTLRTEGEPAVVAAERRHAISQLRALDRHHLGQIEKVHARFDSVFTADSHALLSEYTAAIEDELSRFKTVLITGGNVVVLMNRLRLFGLDRLLQRKNIIAWSAGAMVLCDHIVLFHDRMPQGRRDPEIVDEGMGLLPSIVLLPDAKGRLRAKDLVRVKLLSRRFAPASCMTLDNGSLLLFESETLRDSEAAKRITRNGSFKRVRAA
ncbi:MAG: Type 1 glutamine amidotransferase-like domain-containing protein [Gammaproteobacteria bacterium]|nr:Type 1 glutamine amidotransferase-like domain-containing protein [Gammaproteobacteria bacterium]